MDDDVTPVTTARTKNSKPCGQPGEYIILPPSFFLNIAGTEALYGDLGKHIYYLKIKTCAYFLLSVAINIYDCCHRVIKPRCWYMSLLTIATGSMKNTVFPTMRLPNSLTHS